MISEASFSKSAPSAPPSPELLACSPRSAHLAPGFRFHPTDEELVSYYLKRKLTGRPIRVDAISEVDLYKHEPWDLPPRSRLRSRDLEWYFFTALDRKYSNRCRTNRATPDGYWKTTGNDRPVHRRSRTVGRKKTLVYHAGRAPRGKRTNWVMHEYRLEDEDLSRARNLQDGYVLCRIFQKSGPGPQNGAQYGAPYMEAEWENDEADDANLVPVSRGGDDVRVDPSGEDYVHLDDFLQNHDTGIQQLDALPFANTKPAKQDMGGNTEDSSFSMDEILNDHISVEECSGLVDFPAMQGIPTLLNGLEENTTVKDQSNDAFIQNNEYAQMKYIFSEQNICFTPDECLNDCLQRENGISLVDGVDDSENLPVKHASWDFDTNGVSNQPDQLQICPLYLDPCDIGNASTEDASAQLAEDNLVYCDALGIDVQNLEENLMNQVSLVPRNEFDFLEELMAYYDATDDTLHYATQDSFMAEFKSFNSTVAEPSASAEAVGRSTSSLDAVHARENYASLDKAPNIDGTFGGFSQNLEKDVQQKVPHGKTLINRLGNTLESISAPPAFAAEPAMIGVVAGQISAASTTSLHVTAGLIQIQNLTAIGFSESWMFRKHVESDFVFSQRLVHKSDLHEPVKEHCGILSLVLRGVFHFFALSKLVLALSHGVGVYVCNLLADLWPRIYTWW